MNRILTMLAAAGLQLGLAAASDAAPLRNNAGPYEMQVLVSGSPARTFYHSGETYLLGQNGERYTVRILNHSGRRIEAVVTVDGRDVVDGKPGDFRNKRGYLVPAYGQVDIDGWRLSRGQVAAFRFSSVADSYAARTGTAREVGVIGVAVFPERYVPPPPPVYLPRPQPHPYYRWEDDADRLGDSSSAPGKAAAKRAAPPPAANEGAPAPPATSSPPPPPRDLQADKYTPPAGGALAEPEWRRKSRSGLGTAFGEAVSAPVREVEFVRASSYPAAVLGVRYNDHDGLLAMGVDVDGWPYEWDETHTRRTADPFPGTERSFATPPSGWEYRE